MILMFDVVNTKKKIPSHGPWIGVPMAGSVIPNHFLITHRNL